ncbi:MAG: hypothetical protein WC836_03475 [Desulfobacula sp.]
MPQNHKKILMIAKEDLFPDAMADYAIQLASRLKYELIAINVNTNSGYHNIFKKTALKLSANAGFHKTAALQGVPWEYQVKCGEFEGVVEDIISDVKGIELILTDSEQNKLEIGEYSSIPVYSFVTQYKQRGESIMAALENNKKPVGKMVGYGIGTILLYTAVFMNVDTVTTYFTKGSWYAALPIATVFVFSFVHGAFASNLWSVLGIEAQKSTGKRLDQKKSTQVSKRPVARPRAYAAKPEARVNPFHRM